MRRFAFEIRITIIMMLLLAVVSLMAIFAYQRFSNVIDQVSENMRPDMRLITAKALVNDLNDAEIAVKSFRITDDQNYLDQFYNSVQSVEEKLEDFHQLNSDFNDIENISQLDSLDTLVNQKITILNDLLLLRDGRRTQKALDKVVEKISSASETDTIIHPTTSNLPEEKPKKKLFSWLFKKKSTNSDTIIKDSLVPVQIIQVQTINEDLNDIRRDELHYAQSYKKKELDLIIQDQIVSRKLAAFFDDFETEELENLNLKNQDTQDQIKATNIQIAWFCALVGALIIFASIIILNYVRKNNQYRRILKKSKKETEELSKAKQKFLANMSHEIRTPLNAIIGFSEQIGSQPLNKEQTEYLNMVKKSSDHLLYLINEILDFSKLQEDKIKLEKIAFSPQDLLDEVGEYMKNETADKNVSCSVDIDSQVPEILNGDPFRLRQILFNLVSNALKFTEKGAIHLELNVIELNNDNCKLELLVKDTGVGIAKEKLATIFNDFEQAESSTSRNFGGSGLGLSIVKLLVDLHQGIITVDSEKGMGTQIKVELPYEISEASAQSLPTSDNNQNIYFDKGLKVLVVDDEKFNRLLIASILRKHKVTFDEASDGKMAVDKLKSTQYDLVLMDVRMPELDGVSAVKKIRKHKNINQHSPIVALTAAVADEDIQSYKKAGFNSFLAKPFKEQQLLQTMFDQLNKNNTPTINKEPQSIDVQLDFTSLKELSGDDQSFFLEMLATFIEGTEQGIINLKQAQQEQQITQAADIAHKMATPCNHMGADQLYKKLKSIEKECRKGNIQQLNDSIQEVEQEALAIIEKVRTEIQNTKA